MSQQDFEKHLSNFISKICKDEKKMKEFFKICSYVRGDYSDFSTLEKYLSSQNNEKENRIFYLSIPPNVFLQSAKSIAQVLVLNKSVIDLECKIENWMESNRC